MIVPFVICAVVIVLVKYLLDWYKDAESKARHINAFPGPKGLPLIGNALDLTKTTDILPSFLKYVQENGYTCRLKVLERYFLLCAEPESVEFILSSNKLITKSVEYNYMHDWLGLGLLTSTGQHWKQHRRIITPTFHFKILEQYISIFDKNSKVMISKLDKEVVKPCTDIFPYITLCTLDTICETAMGLNLNSQNSKNMDYVEAVREMGRLVIRRSFSFYKRNDLLYKLTDDYRTTNKMMSILNKVTDDVVAKRQQYMQDNPEKFKDTNEDNFHTKKMAFLDMLLQINQNEKVLTIQDIKDEVATFMFEGHDTTSSGVCFTMYCLAENPEIQAKVYEEIQEVFGDDKMRPTNYNDLQNLKYLEMVIKESLRLYPTVPFYARETLEDTPYKDKIIPKETTLAVFAYGLHRNPAVFPNPDKFDPERFSTENQSKRSAYAYVPFSAGPRNCIGQKFAMLELKCIVSKVLRNYKLVSVPERKPLLSAETIIKSLNGIWMKIEKR